MMSHQAPPSSFQPPPPHPRQQASAPSHGKPPGKPPVISPQTRRRLVFGCFFAVAAFAVARWIWSEMGHQHGGEAKIILYDLGRQHLASYPIQTKPGMASTASLSVFRVPGGGVLRPGMTLEEVEEAGLLVGWMYRVDPADDKPLYAAPAAPDAWISDTDPGFARWMAKRMEEVRRKAKGRPFTPVAL